LPGRGPVADLVARLDTAGVRRLAEPALRLPLAATSAPSAVRPESRR
jgi:hypothetical protein